MGLSQKEVLGQVIEESFHQRLLLPGRGPHQTPAIEKKNSQPALDAQPAGKFPHNLQRNPLDLGGGVQGTKEGDPFLAGSFQAVAENRKGLPQARSQLAAAKIGCSVLPGRLGSQIELK